MEFKTPKGKSCDNLNEEIMNNIKKNNYKLTADKIITTFSSIKNNPNISSKRWIWELMQNATDIRYDNEKISVQIIREEDKLIFMHNGRYFTTKNILGLLQQVSSKNSLNLEGQTGKFGTGFIGTHLLSDIIDIKGILHISDNNFREFQITLDRSQRSSEELSEYIKKSIEEFYHIKDRKDIFKKRPNYLQNRKETDYDTSFIYYLKNEDNKKAATEGLNDLINTMPTTLITQHKKIKQVTIIDKINNINTTYISNIEKEVENDITESSVKIIKKNKENKESISKLYFLSYLYTKNNKEILRLIIEIEKKDGIIYILKRDKNKPVLYRNFPLIGSNEFHMPFIVDGFNFNPLEARNGIFLNGGQSENNLDTKENIDILNEAYKSSFEFIKCIFKKYKNVGKRFLLASSKVPKSIVAFDSFADEWILKKQKDLRENLKELNLLKFGKYYKMKYLLLPIFHESNGEKYNIDLYNIVYNINIRKKILPETEDFKSWYNIIIQENDDIKGQEIEDNKYIQSWGKTEENKINYIYDENDLLIDIQKCKNIKNLSDTLKINKSDTIEYLNEFLGFLGDNCKYEIILNNYSIIPNRNGEFKKINELYTDNTNKIPKVIIDIYDSISEKKLNEELIDTEININNLNGIINKKDFEDISKYLNNYILKNKNINNIKNLVVYPLLSIKTDKNEIQQIYEFLRLFYSLEQKEIEITDKKKIPIDLWTYALNFWYDEHPKEIESYNNINGLKEKINKKYEDSEILKWMNDYLNFLKLNRSSNFEKLKIFPNQNKNFCELEKLYLDSGFPEEYKDILKNHFNIDERENLLSKEIKAYESHKLMSEYDITNKIELEFNKLKEKNKNNNKLKDISFDMLCLYPINEGQETIKKYLEQIIYPLNRTSENLLQSPIDYSGLSEIILNKSEKYTYKKINTNTLNYLPYINYIIEILCDEIDKCNNFENIKNKFYGIKTQNDLELLLIKIIKFQWDNEKNEKYKVNDYVGYNSNKKIFLNMNNNLISINDIRIKEEFNFDENNEKILLDICLNKHINKDFRNELINENIFKQLSCYKNKFKSYKLKDICNEIDQVIMKYDQTNSNNGVTYDNDFFNITQNLKKIKCSKEEMKELFPYYWKNKSRISISCFNEDEADHLMSLINKDNFENQIKFLDSFSSSKSFQSLFKFLDICGGDVNKLLDKFLIRYGIPPYIDVKINQKFQFKFKHIDENQKETYIYSEPLTFPEEDISGYNWDFNHNNDIEFEC